MHVVPISDTIALSNAGPMTIIAGPCSLEGITLCQDVAGSLTEWCEERGLNYIFKGSFDKANRSRATSYRGPGLDAGLMILDAVSSIAPTTTDIHTAEQADLVAEVVQLLQIPALLSRQLDLLEAAIATGKPVNIKKGQFMAPQAATNLVENAEYYSSRLPYWNQEGCARVVLTERGATFGSGDLVVDPRALHYMRGTGYPVVMDCTHACQTPKGGVTTEGNRENAEPIARAALAQGIAGLFFETHPDPEFALSDGANSLRLRDVPKFLDNLVPIDRAAKGGASHVRSGS